MCLDARQTLLNEDFLPLPANLSTQNSVTGPLQLNTTDGVAYMAGFGGISLQPQRNCTEKRDLLRSFLASATTRPQKVSHPP